MTYDELLATIDSSYNRTDDDAGRMKLALRAVVELHKPAPIHNTPWFCCSVCTHNTDKDLTPYPCPTIQAIEGQLE